MRGIARGPKIVTIVGARPQFVKLSAISKAIAKQKGSDHLREILVHTGQHYDRNMSDIFFRGLEISSCKYHLGIRGNSPAEQTGRMLGALERVLLKESPDGVLVYGDTNSTLAGALAAAQSNIPLFHVEAGLRSYDRRMPEEINRVVTDHLSSLLLCPTQNAAANLKKESIKAGTVVTGDVMADLVKQSIPNLGRATEWFDTLGLKTRRFLLLTVHRPENTDDYNHMMSLVKILESIREPCVFPIHPRTIKKMHKYNLFKRLRMIPEIKIIKPVGYYQMLLLEKLARKVLTDSGGVQKEAYLLGTPCLTLRHNTEWIETLQGGWNTITGLDWEAIQAALRFVPNDRRRTHLFGDGNAAGKIVRQIEAFFSR